MTDMWRNEYGAPAGKGARARKRLRIEDVPKTMNVKPRKNKPKAYAQKPEYEARKRKRENMSEAYYSAIGLKARVRLLVIDRDISFLELMETLKRDGVPLSGVTAGNLRTEMREIMKLLESLKLLDVEALQRRRKKIKAGDRV